MSEEGRVDIRHCCAGGESCRWHKLSMSWGVEQLSILQGVDWHPLLTCHHNLQSCTVIHGQPQMSNMDCKIFLFNSKLKQNIHRNYHQEFYRRKYCHLLFPLTSSLCHRQHFYVMEHRQPVFTKAKIGCVTCVINPCTAESHIHCVSSSLMVTRTDSMML